MKTCFKCGENKPLNEFYKHSQMADGRLNKCKGCTKKDVSSHRHGAGREKVLAYDRARALTPERIAHRSRHVSDWRASFPERAAAQASLAYAVKTGKVYRWPVCAVPECSGKPVAHHPDYSQPLSVVWLCQAHHKQAHAIAANDSSVRDADAVNQK